MLETCSCLFARVLTMVNQTTLNFSFVMPPAGDVLLRDLRIKQEAFQKLQLPISVKAGVIGSVRLQASPETVNVTILFTSLLNMPSLFNFSCVRMTTCDDQSHGHTIPVG